MKAAIRRHYGTPDSIKIEEIDKPKPNDNEILVRIRATTVNRTDCANLTAKPFIMRFVLGLFKPRKTILGTDFAGEIVEIGKNIENFKPGDRVFGFTDTGIKSQAEYMAIDPRDKVLLLPDNVDFVQGAASLEGAHYAYSFVHKTKIRTGSRLLINGASGAIGSALIQFIKPISADITATCNSKSARLIAALGANRVIVYTEEDFTKIEDKFDYIFDAVGKSTFGKCRHLLKKDGVYISSELGPYSQNLFLAIWTSFSKRKKVIFPIPYSLKKTLPYIHKHLEKGTFNPVVDQTFDLDSIAQAYTYVLTGQKTGNVIIEL